MMKLQVSVFVQVCGLHQTILQQRRACNCYVGVYKKCSNSLHCAFPISFICFPVSLKELPEKSVESASSEQLPIESILRSILLFIRGAFLILFELIVDDRSIHS